MTTAPLRVGVIGLGFGRFHATCLAARDDVRLVAVAGREREDLGMSVAAFAQQLGARAFAGGRELLDADLALDAVTIATPPDGRAHLVAAALERGLAVLLEKPVAITVAEATALAALVDERRGHVEVNHEMRHLPAVARLRRLLDEDRLGGVELLACDYAMGRPPTGSWVVRPGTPGPLVENTCHALDLVHHLAGSVTRVYAEAAGGTRDPVMGAAITLRLASGGAATVSGGGVATDELGVRPYINVYGSRGQAVLEGSAHELHRLRWAVPGSAPEEFDAGAPSVSHLDVGPLDAPSLLAPAIADFVDRVRTGNAPATPIRQATVAVRLAEAALASIGSGRPIDLEGVT